MQVNAEYQNGKLVNLTLSASFNQPNYYPGVGSYTELDVKNLEAIQEFALSGGKSVLP